MRETQKGQSETQRDLTVAIPMTDEATAKQADAVFRAIDGDLPISAIAECVNDTSHNDSAYSCHIRPKGAMNRNSMAGLKVFLGNPDEGYDYAQVFCGSDPAQTPCDWDEDETDTFDDLPTLQTWLFHQMTEAKHPLFKQIGLTPLNIETMDNVRTYLTLLSNHGLSYHMDDDSWDSLVYNEVRDAMGRKHRKSEFSMWEGVLLEHYHNLCWDVCKKCYHDIHDECYEAHKASEALFERLLQMRPDVRSATHDVILNKSKAMFQVIDKLGDSLTKTM